jgi:hypothetical protein
LHGRVIPDKNTSVEDIDDGSIPMKAPIPHHHNQKSSLTASSQLWSIRKQMERKSKLSELTNEMKHFQQMVAELDSILSMAQSPPRHQHQPETPQRVSAFTERQPHDEAIEDRNAHQWRARIKIKAAQEADTKLFEKLYNYEKTLSRSHSSNNNNNNINNKETIMMKSTSTTNAATFMDDEVREAQTACMRLHRDFKQTHKQLVMVLSKYYNAQPQDSPQLSDSQRSLLGQLGSGVGWTGLHRQGSSCSLSSSSIPAIEPVSPIQTAERQPPLLVNHHASLVTPPTVSPIQRKETPDVGSNTSETLNTCSTAEEEEEYEEEEEENPTEYESTIGEDLCWFCGAFGSNHPNLSFTLREEVDMATNEVMLIGKEVVLKSKHILEDPTHRFSMPMNAFDCGNNSYQEQQQQSHPVVVNQS